MKRWYEAHMNQKDSNEEMVELFKAFGGNDCNGCNDRNECNGQNDRNNNCGRWPHQPRRLHRPRLLRSHDKRGRVVSVSQFAREHT